MPQLPTGVIEQFLHPPLGVMTRELIVGLFSGSGVLTRPRGPVPVDAFGLTVDFVTIPAGMGFVVGNYNQYFDRIVQLSVIHTLLDGHSVISESFDVHAEAFPLIFAEALPTQVNYFIAPGCQVSFHWLLAL